MAVAYRTSVESQRTGTTDPHTFSVTIDAADTGVAVAIGHGTANTDLVVGVTVGGVSLTRVVTHTDNLTEPGRVYLYFLGSGLPAAGSQTVSIDLTSATTTDIECVAVMFTGDADLEVVDFDGTSNLNQDDPTLTLNYAGRTCITLGILYSGVATVLTGATPNGNMTLVEEFDIAAFGVRVDRQTTPGTSDFTFSYTTAAADDVAIAAMAISEVVVNATGSGGVLIDAPGAAVAGKETMTGSGSAIIAAPTASGSAVETFAGSAAVTISASSATATGDVVAPNATGTANVTIAAPATAGTGDETMTGTANVTIAAPATAGTGDETMTGTAAVGIAAPATAGTGDVASSGVAGTGAIAVAAPAAAVSGIEAMRGAGALSLAAPVAGAAGTLTLVGSGGLTIASSAVSGDGVSLVDVTGTAAITIAAASLASIGTTPELEGEPALGAEPVGGWGRPLEVYLRRVPGVRGEGQTEITGPSIAGTGTVTDDELVLAMVA